MLFQQNIALLFIQTTDKLQVYEKVFNNWAGACRLCC